MFTYFTEQCTYLCPTDASVLSMSAALLSNLESNYEQTGVQPLVFCLDFFFFLKTAVLHHS